LVCFFCACSRACLATDSTAVSVAARDSAVEAVVAAALTTTVDWLFADVELVDRTSETSGMNHTRGL
jgi:hypothetical protein